MPIDLSVTPLTITSLHRGYLAGEFTPKEVMQAIRQRSKEYSDRNIWIHLLDEAEQAVYLQRLEKQMVDELPLYGIPFAIKDNIDLGGVATTAGCPAYRYTPGSHAYVVNCLIEAGAIPVGKTNLDQFATGLVGVRSPEPWGPCGNAFDPDFISGGSSSGSAVATALGLCSFSLGTDTAGSGRVPAALNNLVGLKPTRGVLSSSGMVPACRTLDTISVFTLNCEDSAAVLDVCAQFDSADDYARPLQDSTWPGIAAVEGFRIAVPEADQLEFFGNREAAALFEQAVDNFRSIGAEIVTRDFSTLFDAARLLYQGPWVAERFAAIEEIVSNNPELLHPTIRDIVAPAAGLSAVECFKAEYQMQSYRRLAEQFFADTDFALTPTAGTTYRISEVVADPITLNSNLGYYTNFMNLLDFAAVAAPAGFLESGQPWGVTLFAPAGSDRSLLALTQKYTSKLQLQLGATGIGKAEEVPVGRDSDDWVPVVVCGAHLSGYPLNSQLTSRGGHLQEKTATASNYRFYALPGGPPHRPGLVRTTQKDGAGIDVEVWVVPASEFGSFVAGIPHPLGIGTVELADGRWLPGFICESIAIDGAQDITSLGSWRNYTAPD